MATIKKLANAVAKSRICLGLDPQVQKPTDFLGLLISDFGVQKALEVWGQAVIDSCEGLTGAVKFQSAFYEAFGTSGFAALENTVNYALQKNLFVIYDAKRGDIASTMEAYGKAAFDVLKADSLTVHIHMGTDVVKSLLPWLQKDKIIYLVWKTSNLSALEFQEIIAAKILELFERFAQKNNIEPALGYVMGVQHIKNPQEWKSLTRMEMPLILPGIGAQGFQIDSDVKNFLKLFPNAMLPISRGITSFDYAVNSLEEFKKICKSRMTSFAEEINK